MTLFYHNKYYSRKNSDNRFYIPLSKIKVDLDKLRYEAYSVIKVDPIKNQGYGITTTSQYVSEYPYNFKRYSGISYLNEQGERILETGERDEELIHWPEVLQNSYIKELGDIFSDLIKIKNPRVRMSVSAGIEFHSDPHTPYRIHIALESNPNCVWKFKEINGTVHTIYQAADGIPVLIETGLTKHSVVKVNDPTAPQRIHLWYQFHDIISDEVLRNL